MQLEILVKELKKKQKDLKENSVRNVFQRSRFSDLKALLTFKVQQYQAADGAWEKEGDGEGKDSRDWARGANMLEVG